jgi:hypothetical protein
MSRLRAFIGEYKHWLILALLFVLLATLAFGLGFVFGRQSNPAPIIIEQH